MIPKIIKEIINKEYNKNTILFFFKKESLFSIRNALIINSALKVNKYLFI